MIEYKVMTFNLNIMTDAIIIIFLPFCKLEWITSYTVTRKTLKIYNIT